MNTIPTPTSKTYIKEIYTRNGQHPNTDTTGAMEDTGFTINTPELHYQCQILKPRQYAYTFQPPIKPDKPHKGTTPKWTPPHIP